MAESLAFGLDIFAALTSLCVILYSAARHMKCFHQKKVSSELDATLPPLAAKNVSGSQDAEKELLLEQDKQEHFRAVMIRNQTILYWVLMIGIVGRCVARVYQFHEQAPTHSFDDQVSLFMCPLSVLLCSWLVTERVRGWRFAILIDLLMHAFAVFLELSIQTLLELFMLKPFLIAFQFSLATMSQTPWFHVIAIWGNAILSSCMSWKLLENKADLIVSLGEYLPFRVVARELAVAAMASTVILMHSKTKIGQLKAELGQKVYQAAVLSLQWMLKYSYDCIVELDEKFKIVAGSDDLEKMLFRGVQSLRGTCLWALLKGPDEVLYVQQHLANLDELSHPIHIRLRDGTGKSVEVEMFCALKCQLQKTRYLIAIREDTDSWRGADGNQIEPHPADSAAFQSNSRTAGAATASLPRPDLLGTPAELLLQNLPQRSAAEPVNETGSMSSRSGLSLLVHDAHDITPRSTQNDALLATIQRWNVRYEYLRCCAYHAKLHAASIRLRDLQGDRCWHHDDGLQLRQCPVCGTVMPSLDRVCMTCRLVGRELR